MCVVAIVTGAMRHVQVMKHPEGIYNYLHTLMTGKENLESRTVEMAQQVKALAAKSDDLSSIPRTYILMEEENQLL